MTYLITIPGTHGIVSEDRWWRYGSRWWDAAEREGFRHPCPEDPFFWDTDLEGTIGENWGWMAAGAALRWWIQAHITIPDLAWTWIVAFSHGGQVAAYALQNRFYDKVRGVVSLGTPVRTDMKETYRMAVPGFIKEWHHIHSDESDIWQAAGALSDQWWGTEFTREMPYANNIEAAGLAHHALVSPDIWDMKGWWGLMR